MSTPIRPIKRHHVSHLAVATLLSAGAASLFLHNPGAANSRACVPPEGKIVDFDELGDSRQSAADLGDAFQATLEVPGYSVVAHETDEIEQALEESTRVDSATTIQILRDTIGVLETENQALQARLTAGPVVEYVAQISVPPGPPLGSPAAPRPISDVVRDATEGKTRAQLIEGIQELGDYLLQREMNHLAERRAWDSRDAAAFGLLDEKLALIAENEGLKRQLAGEQAEDDQAEAKAEAERRKRREREAAKRAAKAAAPAAPDTTESE